MEDPQINLAVYQSNKAAGGPGGPRYTFEDKNAFLSTLVVHRDDDFIRGLTMELSNSRTENVGELVDSNPVILSFQDCQITNIVVFYGYSSRWDKPIVNGILKV